MRQMIRFFYQINQGTYFEKQVIFSSLTAKQQALLYRVKSIWQGIAFLFGMTIFPFIISQQEAVELFTVGVFIFLLIANWITRWQLEASNFNLKSLDFLLGYRYNALEREIHQKQVMHYYLTLQLMALVFVLLQIGCYPVIIRTIGWWQYSALVATTCLVTLIWLPKQMNTFMRNGQSSVISWQAKYIFGLIGAILCKLLIDQHVVQGLLTLNFALVVFYGLAGYLLLQLCFRKKAQQMTTKNLWQFALVDQIVNKVSLVNILLVVSVVAPITMQYYIVALLQLMLALFFTPSYGSRQMWLTYYKLLGHPRPMIQQYAVISYLINAGLWFVLALFGRFHLSVILYGLVSLAVVYLLKISIALVLLQQKRADTAKIKYIAWLNLLIVALMLAGAIGWLR